MCILKEPVTVLYLVCFCRCVLFLVCTKYQTLCCASGYWDAYRLGANLHALKFLKLLTSVCLDFFSWNAPNLLKDWRQTNRIEKAKIEKKNVLRIIPTCQLCCDCSMVLWELFVLLLFPLSLARPTSSCQEGASFCLNGIKETGRFVFFQSCLGLDQTRSSVFFSWGPKCLVFRRGFLRVGVGCT